MRTFWLLVCTALPALGQSVEPWVWKNVNIQGMGYVTGLVAQPADPFDVYIRTDVGGVYRYDRQALRWIPLTDALDSPPGTGVESVAIDPSNPQRVYAVMGRPASSKNGKWSFAAEIMVSEDQGQTWRRTGLGQHGIYQGANDDYRVETGERLAVDPANPSVLYFATRRSGLWKGVRQDDARYAWIAVSGGLPPWTGDPAGYTFVVFDSSNVTAGTTQTIYVGVHGSGVWRSSDAGATWFSLGGADNPCRAALASDGTLYVSFGTLGPGSGSVRRYRDGEWADISPADRNSPYYGISVDPADPKTVMVGRDRFVYRSLNGGTTWSTQRMTMHKNDPRDSGSNPSAPPYYLSSTAGASGGVAALVIDPSDRRQVWWTNGWGVARTDDVFVEQPFWAWRMDNLEELVGVAVAVPPKPKGDGGADLISMAMDMIGFRHADRDQVPEVKISPSGVPLNPHPSLSWQRSSYGSAYPVPWPHVTMGSSVDYCYRNPDSLAFVGQLQWQTWSVYGSSSDNGRTWAAFPSMPVEKLWTNGAQQDSTPVGGQIAMSATNPQNMIWAPTWGTFDGGSGSAAASPWPQFTMDGGKTWRLCRLVDPPSRPEPFNAQNNAHLHYDALPRSWANSIHPYVSSNVLSADRADPDGKTFYYLDNMAFYYSNDGGATWTKSETGGFPAYIVRVTIAPNPAVKGDVWMAFARNAEDVNGSPLFRSTDGGRTFAKLPGVDLCDKVAFGKGTDNDQPFVYIFGRASGAARDAIYKSEDLGQSWIRLTNPDSHAMGEIAMMTGDMRTANLLYLAMGGRGVMYGAPANDAPRPAVDGDGIRNAASGQAGVTRGSLVRVRGTDLARTSLKVSVMPLPRQLGATSVTVKGFRAPLVSVSPEEIYFQMPWELALDETVDVRVVNGLGESSAVSTTLVRAAPGLFEAEVRHLDGNLVNGDQPATAGEEIVVRATGFGDWTGVPESGFGSPGSPELMNSVTATLGGGPAEVTLVTLVPGLVGLSDVRVKLPAELPEGEDLMLIVMTDGAASNAVAVRVLH